MKATHITSTLGVLLLAFIAYGFVTDYLGYELTPKGTAENAVPANAVEHRVERIVDGDTVYLKDGTKVRLLGIDTPERDQPYGTQATRNLNKLIGGKVFVVEKDTDRYGRLVGDSLSRCQCSFQNSYLMYLGGNHHMGTRLGTHTTMTIRTPITV